MTLERAFQENYLWIKTKKKENQRNKEQNLIHMSRIIMNVNEKEPL